MLQLQRVGTQLLGTSSAGCKEPLVTEPIVTMHGNQFAIGVILFFMFVGFAVCALFAPDGNKSAAGQFTLKQLV